MSITLKVISKLNQKSTHLLVSSIVYTVRAVGGQVRKDKDGHRFFFRLAGDDYIITCRAKVWRPVNTKDGDTYRAYNAGYFTFYRGMNAVRSMWGTPQEYKGE